MELEVFVLKRKELRCVALQLNYSLFRYAIRLDVLFSILNEKIFTFFCLAAERTRHSVLHCKWDGSKFDYH